MSWVEEWNAARNDSIIAAQYVIQRRAKEALDYRFASRIVATHFNVPCSGLVGYGVDDTRDLKKRVPLIELSNNLEQAKKQAAEIWRNRTGLDPSEDPPEGYAIWDARGACQFSYYLSEVIRAEHGINGGRGNGLQGRNRN
jgi:hypothetical protein